MTADQFIKTAGLIVDVVISTAIAWAKILASLGVALMVLATIAAMTGHPIPFVPGLKGGLQELGVFIAGFAYWASR